MANDETYVDVDAERVLLPKLVQIISHGQEIFGHQERFRLEFDISGGVHRWNLGIDVNVGARWRRLYVTMSTTPGGNTQCI